MKPEAEVKIIEVTLIEIPFQNMLQIREIAQSALIWHDSKFQTSKDEREKYQMEIRKVW